MPFTTLAFKGMPPPFAIASSSILSWYAAYHRDFTEHFATTPPHRYYAADCHFYQPDNTLLPAGVRVWDYVGTLYGAFPKVTREVRSFIVLSNEDVDGDEVARTHEIHATLTTTLWLDAEGGRNVEVPQSFVYVVGRADEGEGWEGWQFRELRNYYDRGVVERAKTMVLRS